MMERIDYWKGFTGGLLAGVAIGTWIYLLPDQRGTKDLSPQQGSESANPSRLVPEARRVDFESTGQ
jgi:hypothetical protein